MMKSHLSPQILNLIALIGNIWLMNGLHEIKQRIHTEGIVDDRLVLWVIRICEPINYICSQK